MDQRGRDERKRYADEKRRSEWNEREKIAAKAAKQVLEAGRDSSFLRPGGGEEADGKHRFQKRCDKLSDRLRRPDLQQSNQQVIAEQQQQPPQRSGAKHGICTPDPDDAVSRIAAREWNRDSARCRPHRSLASRAMRWRRMRSNGSGSCACVNSPGRGR